MINRIKFYLYRRGYLKLTSARDKIDYLRNIGVQPYTQECSIASITTVSNTITTYTSELGVINRMDWVEVYIKVKPITNDTLTEVSVPAWFTVDGSMISDPNEALSSWLAEADEFITRYDEAVKRIDTGLLYSNSLKARPYRINIESILDELLNIVV